MILVMSCSYLLCSFLIFLVLCLAEWSLDDVNDFDNMAMYDASFNDVCLLIMSIDGEEYVNKLQARMQISLTEKAPTGEDSWLLGNG